ncbi:orotidine-5'-phosphate decarboxylase [Syntrophobacter fumaroxidans]|uniref:Orotidine 5'-phosphate decarboxylase n=1 Tax=Syntrophobacter fumaroxidans (strain DSM 10017 / MPOB) TaxID=335543 RepID=A0LJ13_SYNFM|nr:orotidine-5'-phosphate decarboxylase [Syntrophobacter fumaroxidans]ABK17415.1 orotidine-5'-phosphate decarboxylase [Syntrophobacter fumaroxidans MPOB]
MSQTPGPGKSIAIDKRIIFALDVESPKTAREWVRRLEGDIGFYKVGLQLFLAGGFGIIDWIVKRGMEVMVDLKFFDVPQTVASAVSQLRDRGISLTTVHGNDAILEAAVTAGYDVKILAVTVLTSLDEGDLRDLGFQCSPEELVLSRARRALRIGCAGVVSSGLEASRLRHELGDRFLVVVPGVRPVANRADDQKRVVDVRAAFLNGADYIVVGRPIRQAANPHELVAGMKVSIKEALEAREAGG